ncbi:Rrf2 family transcriptional regulator [Vitreoscilla massiliensis]|uniref:Rrf2 family transcriptional regulator n=1 Tax=Vitreoscilla massiliensis TaxID=1689272 RepID=A0ABY4E552_9NEIS|nr:Rrf2 family transcriptional regulator [Vitreoscilla massiliensis]UOO90515.1 Rrf2 family transcriptional regulator [Vitreoscilla massiliensis]
MKNTRLSMAIHILSMVATATDPMSLTSEWMAGSINTNAVVVRRLVGQLKQAGLITAVQTNRGLRLCKPARDISFWDVLQAVDAEHELFAIHSGSNVQCDIGCQIETVLSQMYANLEQVWRQQLQAQSLQDALDSLQ